MLCSAYLRRHELVSNGILIVRARPSAGCRATGNHATPEDAAWPAQARARNLPAAPAAPGKPAAPRGPRWLPGTRTGRPHRITAGNQAAQDRSGPPASQDQLLLAQEER